MGDFIDGGWSGGRLPVEHRPADLFEKGINEGASHERQRIAEALGITSDVLGDLYSPDGQTQQAAWAVLEQAVGIKLDETAQAEAPLDEEASSRSRHPSSSPALKLGKRIDLDG
jgi:hypothetical protein